MSKAQITLYSLGGTIAMTGDQRSGLNPTLDAAELVRAIPALADVAEITAHSFRNEPSSNLTPLDILDLARAIESVATADADGIVIAQGTDTLEECAFLLEILVRVRIPVVFTGAMRSPSLAGSDGPGNLLAATLAAAHPPLADAGVVVVMNEQIHAAAYVSKTHTADPAAFRSPSLGPIGSIHECRVRLQSVPRRLPHLPLRDVANWPRIGLISASLDDAGLLQDWLEAGRTDGLVVEAFGAGHLSRAAAALLAHRAEDQPVVLVSRTGAGPVFTQTYGYEGAERDLIGRGLIPAGVLTGPKARLLLGAAIASGMSCREIRDLFSGLHL